MSELEEESRVQNNTFIQRGLDNTDSSTTSDEANSGISNENKNDYKQRTIKC